MFEFFLWLPEPSLLAPSLADPRAPISQVTTRFGDDRLDATLGIDAPLVQVHAVQLHLVAAGWMSFRQDGPLTYALLTFDEPFAQANGRDGKHVVQWPVFAATGAGHWDGCFVVMIKNAVAQVTDDGLHNRLGVVAFSEVAQAVGLEP